MCNANLSNSNRCLQTGAPPKSNLQNIISSKINLIGSQAKIVQGSSPSLRVSNKKKVLLLGKPRYKTSPKSWDKDAIVV